MRSVARHALPLLVLALLGCKNTTEHRERTRDLVGSEGKAEIEPREVVRLDPATAEVELRAEDVDPCAVLRKQLLSLEALPGAPGLALRRVEVLGRALAEPVVFERAPGSRENLTPEAERLRERLQAASSPAEGLHRVLSATRRNLALRRAVLLREGYLYAESPALASVLASSLRLDHLFDERELVLERGGQVRRLFREAERYIDAPDAEGGRASRSERSEVSLLLFDRVGPSEAPREAPLHFSVRQVVEAAGASALDVERITQEGILVSLRYGDVAVPAVLERSGTETKLRCESIPEASRRRVEQARLLAARRRATFGPLRAAIDAMVEEQLPFDEPKTEEGQQDGKLRPAWSQAYYRGEKTYEFNGDEYAVFDGLGRPKVPQVCIDFITDAFERASGAWWAPRGQKRARAPGRINFRRLGIENPRSIESLLAFARTAPEWFDVVLLPEKVPFRKRQEFFAKIAEKSDLYQLGDVIFIHGLRDDDKLHYHSFFVYDADPVTGAPTRLAANAGRPRVRTWEGEMQSAPKRYVVARLRPQIEFLEALLTGDGPLAPVRQPSEPAVEPNPGSR